MSLIREKRNMRKFTLYLLAGVIVSFAIPEHSFSQFYKIYGYATPEAGEKELVYWLSYIPSSDNTYSFFGKNVDRKGLIAHSFEIEYALSNKFSVALYADFEQPKGSDLKWVKTKAVMARYRLYEKNSRPVDIALYAEYKLPRKGYKPSFKDSEELELKVILEKDFGFHTFVANPTFEKAMSGYEVSKDVEFIFNCGYYYKKSLTMQPGIEFYAKMGGLREINPFDEQTNYIFPTIDFTFGTKGNIIWHLGMGVGLTDPADNIIFKSIISYGFF